MRVSWPLLAILALSSLPVVEAQTEPLGPWILQDLSGDGELRGGNLATSPIPAGMAGYPDIDLLTMEETRDEFVASIVLYPRTDPSGFSAIVYAGMTFLSGRQAYEVQFPPSEAGVGAAALYRVDGAGQRRFVEAVGTETDPARQHITFTLRRASLYDESGGVPGPGATLESIVAYATSAQVTIGPSGPAYSFDKVPNQGGGEYDVRLGLEQTGSGRLSSPQPTRASNGEASTFVFTVVASNQGTREETYTVRWEGANPAWDVQMLDSTFRLAPGKSLAKNLLITTPFFHQHGSFETLRLILESPTDPGTAGQLDVGIRYHAVPQPAGHHSTIYLHARQPQPGLPGLDLLLGDAGGAWMNTLFEDPEGDQVPALADSNFRPITNFTWNIRLSPSLDIGLEFEEGKQGTLHIPVQTQVPQDGATLEAKILLQVPAVTGGLELQTLASTPVSAPQQLQSNQPANFDLAVDPIPGRYPYVYGSELFLQVILHTNQPTAVTAQEVPSILPGGFLELPLLEYRDALPVIAADVGPLSFATMGATQRVGNPGDLFLFQADLRNNGDTPRLARLRLDGVHSDWATLVGEVERTVPGHGNDTVQVVVRIPANAVATDLADIVMTAVHDDTSLPAPIARFVTLVDTSTERPDDAATAESLLAPSDGRTTPVPSLGLLVLALALLVTRRRV